ncbi:hypothetical protein ACFVUW_10465 [Streptomyces xiamenensis]|uniref:hypothetical protein n=1 Tax=Streptomyces xiamenensis TaxID=408015 RepID=UPI0036E1E2F7
MRSPRSQTPGVGGAVGRLEVLVGTVIGQRLFLPPGPAAAVRDLGDMIRTPITCGYAEFMAHAGGQAEEALFVFPPEQLRFLTPGEVMSVWRQHAEMPPQDEQDAGYACEGRVRTTLFDRARIPIAANEEGGAIAWIDGAPGPTGAVGQIIVNITEVDWAVVANSLPELLWSYVSMVENGLAVVERMPHEIADAHWLTVCGQPLDFPAYRQITGR